MQLRRATFASLIAIWIVASGVLARRHEALVAHAIEASTGASIHGERLIGHHTDNSQSTFGHLNADGLSFVDRHYPSPR